MPPLAAGMRTDPPVSLPMHTCAKWIIEPGSDITYDCWTYVNPVVSRHSRAGPSRRASSILIAVASRIERVVIIYPVLSRTVRIGKLGAEKQVASINAQVCGEIDCLRFGLANDRGAEVDQFLHSWRILGRCIVEIEPSSIAHGGLQPFHIDDVLDSYAEALERFRGAGVEGIRTRWYGDSLCVVGDDIDGHRKEGVIWTRNGTAHE